MTNDRNQRTITERFQGGLLRKSDRRGAAVVEFAVVVPIFLILVLGMMETGRAVMVQQIMTNATREGARRAVLDGVSEDDAKTAVVNYLAGANITVDAGYVTVTTNPAIPPDYADSRTVSVSIPFSEVSWLPSPIYFTGSKGTLVAESTMRRETVE